MIVLGAWSTRINKWGAFAGSAAAGALYILLSPYVFPSLAVGKGLIANLGFAAALVSVPIGFVVTVVVSLASERLAAESLAPVRAQTQILVERMHGWPTVTGARYADATWLWLLSLLWIPVLWWGLQPW